MTKWSTQIDIVALRHCPRSANFVHCLNAFTFADMSPLCFVGRLPECRLHHPFVAPSVSMEVPLECSAFRRAFSWSGDQTKRPLLKLGPKFMADFFDFVRLGNLGNFYLIIKAPNRDDLPVPSTPWFRICHSLVDSGYRDSIGSCCIDRAGNNGANKNKYGSCESEETHGGLMDLVFANDGSVD